MSIFLDNYFMETKASTALGERIETLKLLKKLTNTELARVANITKQSVADIIEGRTSSPKMSVISAWVREYGLKYEWIVDGEGSIFGDVSEKANGQNSNVPKSIVNLLTNEMRHKDDFIAQLLEEVGKPEGVLEADSMGQFDWSLNFANLPGTVVGTPDPKIGYIG